MMGILMLIVLFISALSATIYQIRIFGEAQSRGAIQNTELNEASGLIASINNPGLLWSHNDSGDKARIFLMDDSAKNKAVYYLEGIKAKDWEEIASLQKDQNYLLIGDIGDNKGVRPYVSIHLIREPIYREGVFYTDTIPAEEIATFNLRYEDGPRDAEAFFYDEMDQKLYVISKRELEVGLYETNLPLEEYHTFNPRDTLQLKKSLF